MTSSSQIVISASRRTDIPAFYMEAFMSQVHRGFFEITNPYNQKVSRVSALPDHVHTIVFWSKNFRPFIENGYGQTLADMGYHLFFNFSLNSESKILEPNVPPLADRFSQLSYLCGHFGPETVTWRFDPICFYRTKENGVENNLSDFSKIAETALKCGVNRCITSFLDMYPKIKKRTEAMDGFSFVDIEPGKKINLLLRMAAHLKDKNIRLSTCCEKFITDRLPPTSGIKSASCIPNDLFVELFGGQLSMKKDYGQRIKSGCGCKTSVDVGSYRHQPCMHNCLFCYANPASHRQGAAG